MNIADFTNERDFMLRVYCMWNARRMECLKCEKTQRNNMYNNSS